MNDKNDTSDSRRIRDVGYDFLIGAVIGLVFAWVVTALALPDFELWNMAASGALILLCGTLSALFGKRGLKALMTLLESFPPIA